MCPNPFPVARRESLFSFSGSPRSGSHTDQDLPYRDDLNQKIDRLGTERKELRNLLKKASRKNDESGMAEIQSEIKRVSKELKKARKEVEYCVDVAERSEQVQQNLKELEADKSELRQAEHPKAPQREALSGVGRG